MKLAIISDIHEDYISLMQAARLIEQNKCDEIVCLGDIVGFSVPFYDYINTRDASACIEWLRENCKYVVAGNHDLYAIRKIPKSKVRQFKYPNNWYKLSFAERRDISKDKLWLYEDNELSALLNEDDASYLEDLPEIIFTEIDGHKCLFSHFIYPDLTGSAKQFVFNYEDIVKHLKFIKEHNCQISFVGHMHFDGVSKLLGKSIEKYSFGKKIPVSAFDWLNVPSISCSKSNNGFLVWDTKNQTIETISLTKRFKLI